MLGGVLDIGVGFVVGWVSHAYGWSWLTTWIKNKFAEIVAKAAANKPQ